MKLQTLFLYIFDVYTVICFNINQTIFKVKTEKPKTEKIRGISRHTLHTTQFMFESLVGQDSEGHDSRVYVLISSCLFLLLLKA